MGDRSDEGNGRHAVGNNVGSGGGSQGQESILVAMGIESGSTVSNLDLGGEEIEGAGRPGSESWKAKKQELIARLRKAKDRQKLLASQLAMQQERFRLEAQEKENYRLELEIRANEERRRAEEAEKAWRDNWEQVVDRMQQERQDREMQFKIEREQLKAALEEKQARLTHYVEMEDLRQEDRERDAQLDQVTQGNVNVRGGGQSNNRIVNWMNEVDQAGQQQVSGQKETVGQGVGVNVWPQHSAAAMAAGRMHQSGVVTSDTTGARVLKELGLNVKTVWFINEHAHTAHTGEPQDIPSQHVVNEITAPQSLFTGLPVTGNIMTSQQGVVDGAVGVTAGLQGGDSGVPGLAGQNVNVGSDGELSSVSTVKCKKKLKTGMLAQPSDNIKSVAVWPHYNLQYEYASKPLQFLQLSFKQYIAGESRTVMSCSDTMEVRGRLNLMFRLAHLKQKGYPWECLRGLYAAVVRGIEMHETSWAGDWRHIEEMVIDVLDRNIPFKLKGKKGGEVWYCREFNRVEGCELQPPHEAQIGKKKRWVKHICAQCWFKEQVPRYHSENDDRCPQKAE